MRVRDWLMLTALVLLNFTSGSVLFYSIFNSSPNAGNGLVTIAVATFLLLASLAYFILSKVDAPESTAGKFRITADDGSTFRVSFDVPLRMEYYPWNKLNFKIKKIVIREIAEALEKQAAKNLDDRLAAEVK